MEQPIPTAICNEKLPSYCQNNPLIPAGIFPTNWRELYDAVARLPDTPVPTHRDKDSFTRLLDLAQLEDFYFPAVRDLRSAASVVKMILKGLADRKPDASYWRAHNSTCNSLVEGKIGHAMSRSSAAAVSIAIIGVSGAGKSTSVENLLRTIPQKLEHDQSTNPLLPRYQVLWMILACTVNRTPRSFITDFFTTLDSILGSDYSDSIGKQNDDQLIIQMGRLARSHFLGILVIDEIQYAAGKSVATDRRLMKLFVRISATIGVPIVFIGTPKAQDVLNAELADARRMLGPQWLPYSADSKEWNVFVDVLCKIQYTKTETVLDPVSKDGTPSPGGLREKIYEISQGIPALAKALWGLAQERVIMRRKYDPEEKITTQVLQDTFDEDMRSVAPAVHALKTKMGLDVFDDLLPRQLPKPKAWEQDSAAMEALALDCYQDALVKSSRQKAREKAEDMFDKDAAV